MLFICIDSIYAVEENNDLNNISYCDDILEVQENSADESNFSDSSNRGDVLEISNENLLSEINLNGGTFADIQDAIDNAADGDIIFLNGGIYTGSGTSIAVNKNVKIIGGSSLSDTAMAKLNGNKLSGIFEVTADNVVLKNIYFEYGKSTENGGAILWSGKNGNVSYCSFINNTAVKYGGAIYCKDGATDFIVIHSDFFNNSVTGTAKYNFGGGAIYWEANDGNVSFCNFYNNSVGVRGGAISFSGAINSYMSYCTFNNNSAGNGDGGGAIYTYGAHNSTMIHSTFIGNSARNGGAYYNYDSKNCTVSDCDFSNNSITTTSGCGGAVYFYSSNCTITYCNFFNNSAGSYGGGAVYAYNPNGVLSYCDFLNNTAKSCGGSINWYGKGCLICNSTFTNSSSKNNGYSTGGAIYFQGSYAINCTVKNCTFVNCYSDFNGGVIYLSATNSTVKNCTFTGNHADKSGGVIYGGYYGCVNNVVDDCTFINNTAGYYGGTVCWVDGPATLSNSRIINSNATNHGGAVYWDTNKGKIINLTIINASSKTGSGGAVFNDGQEFYVEGCNFTNVSAARYGGTLHSGSADTTFTCCNVINSSSDLGGGAIYLYSTGSYVTFSNFTNTSTKGNGGTVESWADGFNIWNCTIVNTSAKGDAGAIWRVGHTPSVFENLTIINSHSDANGGAIVWGNGTGGRMCYVDITNSSAKGDGGAIYAPRYAGKAWNITIVNSSAGGDGGAVFWKNNQQDLSNFTIINSSSKKRGGAIYFYSFFNKFINVSITNSSSVDNGGAIYFDTTFNGGCLRNATFVNTSSKAKGGAIYTNSDPGVYDVKFINTSAVDGGAVYWDYFMGHLINATFINTSASNNGGGVLWTRSYQYTLPYYGVLENASFTNCSADVDGGAIYWNSSKGTVKNASFVNNAAQTYGGAVYWDSSEGLITNVSFVNNSAKDVSYYTYGGGGIYWKAANGNLSDANFVNNSGRRGGAVYWYSSHGNVSFCNFTNNSGWYGGALYFDDKCSYHDVSNCNFVNNSVSTSSSAGDGGAIYWYASHGNLSFCNFTDNRAGNWGGAVRWVTSHGNIWNCSFVHNYARKGAGAIHWNNGEYADISNCSFDKNYAGESYSGSGGAVYLSVRYANLTHSTFTNNFACGSGGALWGDYINIIIDDCNFTNNSAKNYNGGSIYWSTGGSSFENGSKIINCIFINSTAKGFGGSINWDAPHAQLINLTIINSSSHGYGGGAVHISGDYSIVDGCNFTNCTTDGNGGGIRSTMSFTNVTNCHFVNTSAKGYADYSGNGGGGAIQLYSQGSYITYSTFINSTTNMDGGALNLQATGIKVFNCSFENTSAVRDGGAIMRKTHDRTVFDNLTFINSEAKTGSGGAIYWKEPGQYDFSYLGRCNFTNTSAKENGGAIYRETANSIFDVIVFNSSAKNGGSIYWKYYGGGMSNINITNSSATERGGAIYAYSFYSYLTNASLINTSAGIDGGAIYLDYSEATLRNINCTNSSANNFGGSIFSNYYGDWYDLNIINSTALDGGAIYRRYDRGNIVNATFTNTSASRDGGALYWTYYASYSPRSLINASFTNSHANRDGGSIYWNAYKATLKNVTFNISSADQDGGAIFWNSADANITKLNFNYIYAGRNGGAVYVNGNNGNISNCNFTNNSAGNNGGAVYWNGTNGILNDSCYFYNNTAIDGGAVYWNGTNGNLSDSTFDLNNASNEGGAIYWQGDVGNVKNSLFTNNTAIYGGGIYWEGNVGFVNGSDFVGNNATNGSAIYKDRKSLSLNITNVQFDKNRANAHHIEIYVMDNETCALADVDVDIYLIANDNIANAIWNDGTNDTIKLANITCVFSEDGIKRPKHTFNEVSTPESPTNEFIDDTKLWQSPYENAQLLEILITAPDGTVIYNITNGKLNRAKANTRGLLSAVRFDDDDINVTDKDGKIHVEFTNLKAGTYNVAAEHKWDKYYTNTANRDSFIVYDFNVTKTTDDVLVTVTQNVTYNVTIFNNGSQIAKDIIISDLIPDQLKLLDYNIVWLNRTAPDWTLDYNENTNEFTIHNSNQLGDVSFIPPFEKVVITLVFKAVKVGEFNNTVSVISNVTKDKIINATSQNTTVVPVVLNINKTANVTVVANNTLVNFTIVVSNVDLGNATGAVVVDVLPVGLTFVDAGVKVDRDGVVSYLGQFGNGARWNVSRLDSDDVVELWVVARVNVSEVKTLTNFVNVTCRENDTEVKNSSDVDVVPVVLDINKTANVTVVANNTLVKYTIVVKNNCEVNATNLMICDMLPEGLIFVDDATSGYYWNESSRIISWNLTRLGAGNIAEFYIVVLTNGIGLRTNEVNVTCKENDTEVKNSTDIEVVPVYLSIVKSATPDKVNVTGNVTFTITVTNLSPVSVTNVNITDVLYDAFKFDGKSTNLICSVSGQTIVWNIDNLANGTSFTVCFNVTVLKEGTFPNVATVKCSENTTEVSNETNVTALPVVDLKIIKTVDRTEVIVGDEVTYTITVTNLGPSDATGVKVVDSDIINHKFVSASSNDYDSETGVWTIGNLTSQSTISLTVKVIFEKVGTYKNTAIVSGNENDTNTSNNIASSENVVVSEKHIEPEPENKTSPAEVPTEYATGNPILMLLLVMFALVFPQFRRFKK